MKMTSLFVIIFSLTAWAQPQSEDFRKAVNNCAGELKLPPPTPGMQMSEENRSKIDTCLKLKGFTPPKRPSEAERVAIDACVKELGLVRPPPGMRPTDEDRAKLRDCMEKKGFTPEKKS